MRLRSLIDGVELPVCDVSFGEGYTSGSELIEQEVSLQHASIQYLHSKQLYTEGLCIIDTNMNFADAVRDLISVTGECVMMGFFFKGKALATINRLECQREYNSNLHYLRYTPTFEGVFEMPPFVDFQYYVILLSKAFYFRLLDPANQLHRDFAEQVRQGIPTNLTNENLAISPAMKQVIHEIRSTCRTGLIKRLYLEAKIMELLMLQLEQLQPLAQAGKSVLRGDDESRILQARSIIEKDYGNPPGLTQLARLVGLNEFKLKQGFKECVGATVHGYAVQLRMEKARQLLLQHRELPVGDIALQVGYKSPAYFTAAFKKHFGVLPSELRQ
ncbi:helix-turn-helix transcriptional regulator [Pontibacter sp. JH31]|uniref:Helix-turn-helix transcriptional regulator n=1 Tax=Pontibacter aquaedesilientis TaxID=2766980 RepID=A0ABR7XFP7_9BACT|nr:AraC family transcriptional regulator [Pontibacter aquaedesilientis]MBD1397115.1 helix-turn-helix transcriptional regulator [Pontibacter aquaedesilientis]